MLCEHYRERLEALEDYLEGRLPTGERARLDEHLRRCAGCRAAIESAELATRILRHSGLAAAPEPDPGFAHRLVARLRAEQESAVDFWRSLEMFAWRMSWAAAILLIVLGGYLWTIDLSSSHEPMAQQEPAEVQEIFPEPFQRPANQEEVLLSLTSNGSGR